MNKKNILAFLILCSNALQAQVPQKVVVEHFTNTLCSVCKNRNPGFYANLSSFPQVIHLAIHPSSPYAACIFNQQNVSDNDGRTLYYGVYGSTPRLVIQGKALANGANYNDPSVFISEFGKTTPVSMQINSWFVTPDSVAVTVSVRTESLHTLQAQQLFVGLSEDVVNATTPNGEQVHFDVFRKALSPVAGSPLVVSPSPGGVLTFTYGVKLKLLWNKSGLSVTAILQDGITHEVTQAEQKKLSNVAASVQLKNAPHMLSVYPNPSKGKIILSNTSAQAGVVDFYSARGKHLRREKLAAGETTEMNNLAAGIYILVITTEEEVFYEKLVVQN